MNDHPENRFKRRKQRTRYLLMQAAAELVLEKGYDAVSIQDITDRADMGRGTFYIHFADKEALFTEILREHAEATVAQIEGALAGLTFPRREYMSWRLYFETAWETRAIMRALMNGRSGWGLYRQLVQWVTALHHDNLTAKRYTTNLDLPPEILSNFAAGALMHITYWWLENDNPYSAEQMADMFYEMVFREPPSAEVKMPLADTAFNPG